MTKHHSLNCALLDIFENVIIANFRQWKAVGLGKSCETSKYIYIYIILLTSICQTRHISTKVKRKQSENNQKYGIQQRQ